MRQSAHRNAARLALLLTIAAPLAAQNASLVKDINPDGPAVGSSIRQLTAAGSRLFFGDVSPKGFSTNLWVSDGMSETTRLVRAFCQDTDCGVGSIDLLGGYRDLALVAVHPDGTGPVLLWRSDGTVAGTFPLSTAVSLSAPVLFKGADYLTGCSGPGNTACNLWKTDGTAAGTVLVNDFAAQGGFLRQVLAADHRLFLATGDGPGGTLWSSNGTAAARIHRFDLGTLQLLATTGDRLYFTVTGSGSGSELWTSDGTAAGTRLLRAFSLVFQEEGIHFLKGKAYFVARDAVYGNELWSTDGTAAGTVRASSFGLDDASIQQVRTVGDRIVFQGADGQHGYQIWSTTGSPGSTKALSNPPCTGCSFLAAGQPWVQVGERLLFPGTDDVHGRELWATDGTAAGTHPVAELCPGSCPSVGFEGLSTATPQGVFFMADDPVHGRELWRSDGTAAGTVRLTDDVKAAPQLGPQGVAEVAAVGAKVYFDFDGDGGPALWVSERPGGAHRVAVVAPHGPSSNPEGLTPLGGSLVFAAQDGEAETIWRTDGTAAGTQPLGSSFGFFSNVTFQRAGNLVYFVTFPGFPNGSRLWATDGTPNGTIPLKDGVQTAMTEFQGKLAFLFQGEGDAVPSLWSSDGTAAGTVKVFDLPAGLSLVSNLTGLGPDLYFTADGFAGGEVWHSDGTTAGTQKIVSIPNLSFASAVAPHFLRLGSRVLFLAAGLWASDGTPAGTVPLLTAERVSDLVPFQGAAYFVATTPSVIGVFRTDGTPDGTELVKELRIAQGTIPPRSFLVAGLGRLWILADDGIHGEELWQSDGTTAGTSLLSDVRPGAGSSHVSDLTPAGNRMYFSATDGVHGFELWQSDGTAAGTRMVQDIAPLGASSSPAHLTATADRLYFSADDGATGRELWSLPLSGSPSCQPSDTALCIGGGGGSGGSGGRYRVEAHWRDFAGNTGMGHAVPLTADTGTFWFFDPANVETIVKVLDGYGVNGHEWVFYGALSNVEYLLTVTDTQTGLVRQYFNPSGQLASAGDTHAFGPQGANAANPRPAVTRAAPSPRPQIAEQTSPTVPCQPSAQRLCLRDNRFAVEVAWKDFQGNTGKGTAVPLAGGTGTTGSFWFFNASNIELVVKALDGQPVNGHFWLFYGALSNVEYTVTVTDTITGVMRTYTNPSGRFASVADTAAF